jgi:Regulator of chromosome condensation (RCC1) repeat
VLGAECRRANRHWFIYRSRSAAITGHRCYKRGCNCSGGYHTCALLVGGTVTCWGKNDNGQIGDASRFGASNATPTIVPGISEALAVTAGGAHTCVVLAGGSASCWGLNRDGQLGASTPYDYSFTPVAVALSASLTKQIAAGGFHTCAIVAADSTVACWGLNSDGQLGFWGTNSSSEGVHSRAGCGDQCAGLPTFLNNVTTIAASIGVGQLPGGPPLGGYHTVALDSSGMDLTPARLRSDRGSPFRKNVTG